MSEGEATAETIERPESSRYFLAEFVQEAPVDDGPDALMVWLDKNLHIAIRQEVEASRKFLPPREETSPMVLDALDGLYKFQAKAYSQVLIRYADTLHQGAKLRDPERVAREKEVRKKIPGLYKNKPPLTVERLQDQQLPLLNMINAFQLQGEKKVLDSLFDQVKSIPGETVVEK
jgi:hypothetical protein